MLAFDNPANAEDATGGYMIIGQGADSCGKYDGARQQPSGIDAVVYEVWLAGYLTGTNKQLPKTNNILGHTDIDGALGWLDNFCHANPTKAVADAAAQLSVFLYPTRQQSADK